MRTIVALPLVSVAVIGLIACSSEEKASKANPPFSGSDGSASAKPETAAVAKIVIALDGEGLRLVNSETGSTRLLAFGTDREATETAVAAQLGAADDRASNGECGAGPMDFSKYDDFSVNFQDGQFVGWFLRHGDHSAALTTMSGVGIGTKRNEMAKSLTLDVNKDSSIGTEFHTGGKGSGGFSGLLESDAPDARITDLWAGTNCIFR